MNSVLFSPIAPCRDPAASDPSFNLVCIIAASSNIKIVPLNIDRERVRLVVFFHCIEHLELQMRLMQIPAHCHPEHRFNCSSLQYNHHNYIFLFWTWQAGEGML